MPDTFKISELDPDLIGISLKPKDGKVSTCLNYITYNSKSAVIDLQQDMHSQYGMSSIEEGKWGIDLTFNNIEKDAGLQKMHDKLAAVSARLVSLMETNQLGIKLRFNDRNECVDKFNPIIKSKTSPLADRVGVTDNKTYAAHSGDRLKIAIDMCRDDPSRPDFKTWVMVSQDPSNRDVREEKSTLDSVFKGDSVRCVIQLTCVWSKAGGRDDGWGVRLKLIGLLLRPRQSVPACPFSDYKIAPVDESAAFDGDDVEVDERCC